jgi:alkylated DNA repair dioxygenase AlkB
MFQLDIFDTTPTPELVEIDNGQYIYIPNFLSKTESDLYYDTFLNEIEWRQEELNMYGKILKYPRLTAWYGDADKPYTYSGSTFEPNPWTEELVALKSKIETKSALKFNSVLLNLYRDGNDSVSWHADDEEELGQNPEIASVNFGATRKFHLKHNVTKEKYEILLDHGSLLIMKGELQHYWKHQVPKTKNKVRPRVNLTFRVVT